MTRIGLATFALLVSIGVFAQNVEMEEARKIAENYLSMQQKHESTLTVSDYHTKRNASGEVLYYIFNFESGGCVIIAGDKRANPILAFSTTNTFTVDENHPSSVFLKGYEAEIEYLKVAELATNISPKWNSIATKKQHKDGGKKVDPLLTCKWNQNKYYNTLCPDDNRKGGQNVAGTDLYDYHVPNGCVAVAMAQIMYYHRYPRQGQGSSSYNSDYGTERANYGATNYDYESMADEVKDGADIYGYSDALARLIYHAGVSVKMGYAPDGSGALSEDVVTALTQRFRYRSSGLINGGNSPESNVSWWKDTLCQSLDKNLPVYYAACNFNSGSPNSVHGCHAFVCDGYSIDGSFTDTMFHFNFGWGGANDLFYSLYNMHGNYHYRCRIITNIEPANNGDTINSFTGRKTLNATYGSFNDGSGRFPYRSNKNCEWLISPQGGKDISKIMLKVGILSLAAGDTVKIYEGNTPNTLVTTITDTAMSQGTYTVNASEALVVFTSSSTTIGDKGFTFNYVATKTSSNYCSTSTSPTKMMSKNGGFGSGNGTAVYDSENTCYWMIAPEGMGYQIKFAFSKFDLAQGDVLDVYRHPSSGGTSLTVWNSFYERGAYRFTIDNKPNLNEPYKVTIQPQQSGDGVALLFRFRTDNNLNATGFEIYWNDSMNIVNIRDYDLGLSKLSVYPNPANDVITMDLYAEREENIQINLYDVVGKNLYSTSKQQVIGEYQERIPVGNYAKGLYMLRITTSKGTVVKKIVVE